MELKYIGITQTQLKLCMQDGYRWIMARISYLISELLVTRASPHELRSVIGAIARRSRIRLFVRVSWVCTQGQCSVSLFRQ